VTSVPDPEILTRRGAGYALGTWRLALQAMELICIVCCAHHLHVPGATQQRSRATTRIGSPGAWYRMLTAILVMDDNCFYLERDLVGAMHVLHTLEQSLNSLVK
jgi:hypothetical protein